MDNSKVPNLVGVETEVIKITNAKHQKEVELMSALLNIYTNGFNLIGSWVSTGENDLEYARLLIITRSFHSMRSSIMLMLRGYYGPAIILLRTVTEDWLVARDCEDYRPTLDALLYEKHRFGDKKLKLKYRDMADRIALKDNSTDIPYTSDYGFQSRFTHTGRISIEIMKNPETNTLKVVPEYDEVLFNACCELLMRNSLKINEIMYYFINSVSQDALKIWNEMADQPIKDIATWLGDLREEYESK